MGLIGRVLDQLTPEQQGRVLTMEMRPGSLERENPKEMGVTLGPCLYGVAGLEMDEPEAPSYKCNPRYWQHSPVREVVEHKLRSSSYYKHGSVNTDTAWGRYDALCGRYGYQRVNGWIRDRVLRTFKVEEPVAALEAV